MIFRYSSSVKARSVSELLAPLDVAARMIYATVSECGTSTIIKRSSTRSQIKPCYRRAPWIHVAA